MLSLGCFLLLLGSVATCSASPGGPVSAAVRVPPLADWRICDEGEWDISGGDVSPYPAHTGDEVVFRVNGTSTSQVGGGTLEVYIAYRGFHVFTSKGDLCEAVACPLAAGSQSLSFRQSLPRVAPPGPYLGTFQARDSGGTVLFCVNINFRIVLGAAGAAAHGSAMHDDSEQHPAHWLA